GQETLLIAGKAHRSRITKSEVQTFDRNGFKVLGGDLTRGNLIDAHIDQAEINLGTLAGLDKALDLLMERFQIVPCAGVDFAIAPGSLALHVTVGDVL